MSKDNTDRQPAGSPASSGGQFKAKTTPTSDVSLTTSPGAHEFRMNPDNHGPAMLEEGADKWYSHGKFYRDPSIDYDAPNPALDKALAEGRAAREAAKAACPSECELGCCHCDQPCY